ncbi:cupredoxin domain-containing protein [Nitrospira moscoviensis]|uniref:Putative Copper-containing oxidoreductase signal peptide protein n=1 Tax=Nitrospira moscoviensis TaxID=42253 RepID=A0A0K2GCE8_NITMO|nr:cupredoxin domain-containing protein [Nitrospira moscoviensis]ALA58623.1 putative Copper-containing oxidoreductase signal peptide protein [Nitrospira moscoviensis]
MMPQNGHMESIPSLSRSRCRLILPVFLVWLCCACDRTHSVSLTAEDFRFVPDVIRVASSAPLTLSVYNAGREIHEFDSPVLIYAATPRRTDKAESAGILLKPGQSLELVMAPPPGTYLYICRRKGHANMTGTLIVE